MLNRRLFAAALAALVLPSPALAGASLQDKFLKKLEAVAQPLGEEDFGKPRSLCACTTDMTVDNRIGLLVYDFVSGPGSSAVAYCKVPVFDDTGALMQSVVCYYWIPLGR